MDRNRRRRFGQNFLDDAMAHAIASDLPVLSGQSILEIGPGHGAMTRHLVERTEDLTCIEIDSECAELVARTFAGRPITVINQDFMKFDLDVWSKTHPQAWAAGNLPYNVATGILVRLVERIGTLSGIMAMVQYEVALRLCAEPCSSDYGSLSVFVASHCDRKLLRKVGPEHFTPKPNVDSATVLLTPRLPIFATPPGFFDFVQACFLHKRKRLSNSLTGPWTKIQIMDAIAGLGLSEHTRAEELSPEVFLDLYRSLHVSSPS
jgi:16S rRNA (adenine1518-N6/adenine1519-N6)-dimethyltransferase